MPKEISQCNKITIRVLNWKVFDQRIKTVLILLGLITKLLRIKYLQLLLYLFEVNYTSKTVI